jgi:hypothetical protein
MFIPAEEALRWVRRAGPDLGHYWPALQAPWATTPLRPCANSNTCHFWRQRWHAFNDGAIASHGQSYQHRLMRTPVDSADSSQPAKKESIMSDQSGSFARRSPFVLINQN